MAKHRAGDRRIISISIPEETARKLDRRVGKGREDGRSATIARMIRESLEAESEERPSDPPVPSRSEERRVGKECRSRGSPYH